MRFRPFLIFVRSPEEGRREKVATKKMAILKYSIDTTGWVW